LIIIFNKPAIQLFEIKGVSSTNLFTPQDELKNFLKQAAFAA